MDDSSGRSNLQDVADYLDSVLKFFQIDERDKITNEPTQKVRFKELDNLMQVHRNDPEMYERLNRIYMHGYSNFLNPNPNRKRWM
jgi:hypothetical protein